MQLRKYQERALEEARDLMRSRVSRFIFQAPTGSGKTVIASEMIRLGLPNNKRFLFVAHRAELLEQTYKKLLKMEIPETAISIIRAGERKRFRPSAPVQIASLMSLKMDHLPAADVVIVDECHRSMGNTYRDLLNRYPKAYVVGLTATPERLDGKPLGDIFRKIVVVAQPRDLIIDGWIEDPVIYGVEDDDLPDLSGCRTKSGDFRIEDLVESVSHGRRRVGSIVDHWKQYAEGLRTLCFAINVKDSQRIVSEFEAQGVRAVHVDAKTLPAKRAQALEDLEEHRIDVLCSCDLFVEGIDIPSVKCAIQARPTASVTVYLQSVGRIMRPWNGVQAVMLDHVGNVDRHGPPSEDREFDLNGSASTGRSGSFRIRKCKTPGCYRQFPITTSICPACGAVYVPTESERSVSMVEGNLVEIKPTDQRLFYERMWRRAYAEGNQPGWVTHQFVERFGALPDSSWKAPARPVREFSEEEKRKQLRVWSGVAHRSSLGSDWVKRKYEMKFGESLPSSAGTAADDAIERLKASGQVKAEVAKTSEIVTGDVE